MNPDFAKLAGSFETVGSEIVHRQTTGSTMEDAWELARTGSPDGTVVVADYQTAGRGRHDRSWYSQPGQDILCSVVLRPRVAIGAELLMVAALSVVCVASSFGLKTGIKWPNDVQVAGSKLAGVIAESTTGPAVGVPDDEAEHLAAVIGIGLNVNLNPTGQSHNAPNATSLGTELGVVVDRFEVFTKLLESIDRYYSNIVAGGSVVSTWREKLTTLGREVTVDSIGPGNPSSLHGIAHDVDSIGRLIVRDVDGRDWPVSAGEVTLRDTK